MASVNRESLRRSFDEQKRTFERLKRDGAMTPESIALIDALMTLLELLIAVFMEKTTTKTGRNSGLPSSRAPQDETARGAPGARGRGPKENAAAAANTRVVTGREESVVEQCWSCGADLAGAACAALRRRYRTILTQAKRELPEIPPRADGQRGRIAKSDAHNLRERLKTYETEVLRFAEDPDVSFTNNRAERDLRMSKVKQKVSGCFRTGTCAHAWCRISSYLQSAAAQGYNPLVAIQIALAGNAANLIDAAQQPESQITTQK